MKNLIIINGSPKQGESTSGLLIKYLEGCLENSNLQIFNINRKPLSQDQIECVKKCDALIIAFPLYIDSIPSHLLMQMNFLEQIDYDKKILVYCIVNNGFYEGQQNQFALRQMKLWCDKSGLTWGGGIGTGAGEMIPMVNYVPLGHGPNKNLGLSIMSMAKCIENGEIFEDKLIRLNWLRWLWRYQASTKLWYPLARKNHVKRKEMFKKKIIE